MVTKSRILIPNFGTALSDYKEVLNSFYISQTLPYPILKLLLFYWRWGHSWFHSDLQLVTAVSTSLLGKSSRVRWAAIAISAVLDGDCSDKPIKIKLSNFCFTIDKGWRYDCCCYCSQSWRKGRDGIHFLPLLRIALTQRFWSIDAFATKW